MATQQEVIKKFMASLDTTKKKGTAALDEAIQACSNFKSAAEAIEQMVKDCKNAVSGTDFLKNSFGIDLDNTDTGAISGSDAGGSKTKTAASIVPESGSLKNFTGNSFTKNGLTVKLVEFPKWTSTNNNIVVTKDLDYDDLEKGSKEYSTAKKYIWQASNTWWIENTLNLVAESYGSNYSFLNSNVKTLCIGFVNDPPTNGSLWYAETSAVNDTSEGKQISLAINLSAFGSLKNDGNPNGESALYEGIPYLDNVIAHEMTHAVMKAVVDNFDSLPQFIKEGTADLTIGNDRRKNYIEDLVSGKKSLEDALNLNDNGTGTFESYVAGYMFLRWIAKQASNLDNVVINNTANNTSITTTDDNKIIKNSGKYVTITTGAGNDSIYNDKGSRVSMVGGKGNDTVFNMQGTSVTINMGEGNDEAHTYEGNSVRVSLGSGKDFFNAYHGKNISVYGGSDDDTILGYGGENLYYVGGAGSDSIYMHSGVKNSTINGGAGNDVIRLQNVTNNLIIYKAGDGNDSISGFNATSTLRFGSSTNVSLQTEKTDVIATVGKGKITLSGAASLSAINIQGSAKNDSIRNTVSGAKIDARGGNDKIYNYASGKVTLSGGSGDDTITNWGSASSMDGGSGNDVIWGDSGKDTLSGGAGNDKLHGEEGNDKIYGGSGNDSLWGGDGNDSLWGGSGKDVFIYKPGEGKDRIFDYSSGDMLKILEDDGSKGSFKKSKYSGGDLTLTISGGGTVIFDGVSKSDKFNINGTTYKISGSKLVKK